MADIVVTFDLWDTVFIDDSDEAIRAERGMPSKFVRRRELIAEALADAGRAVDRAVVDAAYAAADAAYGKVWHDLAVTWTVPDRLKLVLAGIGVLLPDPLFDRLVRDHEDMELHLPPLLADGVADAIHELAGRYTLGVVSDTIFSPGRALRLILDNYGLLGCFKAFAFSDEVGRSKPAAAMFDAISEQLGVPHAAIVHIGDRVTKDIDGPHVVGARGLLTTVVKQRDERGGEPDARCDDYARLGAIIDAMAGA